MQVLKIATAGSVDDGKSTLIGRLLYDTNSLTDDKLEAIKKKSKTKGLAYLDFSLATDGLVAEREQGITIDVAHIYFSTKKRSYIIADTPGHVEYTRNMVTGASTSQASIVVIDARKGAIEQTYRHFFINNLLRVKDIVVAINKMDLVNYDVDIYNDIKSNVEALAAKSNYQDQRITFIPLSALNGDNVVDASENTPWYHGPTLLEHLDQIESKDVFETAQTRFPVQTVIRPQSNEFHDFRGYAGKLVGGSIQVGDEVSILPSNTQSTVKEIRFFDQSYLQAEAGSAVTLLLTDDVDVSRGDMIVKSSERPKVEKEVTATICWMDKKPLTTATKYVIQHGTKNAVAKVSSVDALIETDYSGTRKASELKLNDIGQITLKLSQPLCYDHYRDNKANGSLILIDSQTNNTAAVGFIG